MKQTLSQFNQSDMQLFHWDLMEYKNSIQGKKVKEAYNDCDSPSYNARVEEALSQYWDARNEIGGNRLTYETEEDLYKGIEHDKIISNMYREID